MQPKTLLIALSVVAFSSCTTVYKSGQTPDDVYYSPARPDNDDQNNNNQDQDQAKNETQEDNRVRMYVHDRRWRDFDDDYSYNNSPYHYCTCNCNNNGYYYNPKYYSWPVYLTKITPPNSTPRTVNLNAYTGYSNSVPVSPKGGSNTGITWIKPTYNTSGGSVVGNIIRHALSPGNSSSNSSSSNNTRTYSPSSSGKSSTSSSSSSSGSGSVTRPKRG